MIQDETPQQKYNSKHKQLEHNNKQYMMLDTMMQDTIDLHQGAECQSSSVVVCQGLLCAISWSVESCRRESVFPAECTLLPSLALTDFSPPCTGD